jgi:hypothetical protein
MNGNPNRLVGWVYPACVVWCGPSCRAGFLPVVCETHVIGSLMHYGLC